MSGNLAPDLPNASLSVGRTRLNAWYGLRYASAPARFAAARPASGRLAASRLLDIPIFPQLPGKLAAAMGHGQANPQSEDAFYANVWAPQNAQGLPVLFFIHGGAWMTGGGAMPWYDGSRLAAQGMVVITVNYRLGALGHLASPQAAPQELPLPAGDLLLALQWAAEHAAHFGGDPTRITLAGQSAGGWYAHLLSTLPQTRGLVHRIALLSMGTREPWPQARQDAITHWVQAHLPDHDLLHVDARQLMQTAQSALAHLPESPRPNLAYAPAAFLPVASSGLPAALLQADWAARACHAEAVYLRYTSDESASFFFQSPHHLHATQDDVDRALATWNDADIPPVLRPHGRYDGAACGLSPYRQLVTASSWRQFQRFPNEYANAMRAAGRPVCLETFSESSPLPDLHAGHCLDLPFQFGNRTAWLDAPMLQDMDTDRFDRISEDLISRLSHFATSRQAPDQDKVRITSST
ncbi:carboxylesterase family protein [Kerstersia similis]|uniref:carboxylesterase family protein n=1 Tax=Kerstersia similis TaxID=206505 RepID=UPI0039EE6799